MKLKPHQIEGGVVQSIVQGANVIVDATDPANPIISAAGGGGGGSSFVPSQVAIPYSKPDPFVIRTDVGTWATYTPGGSAVGGGGIYNASNVAGDSVAFTFYIDPGTYDLNVYGDFSNSRAIVTYEVETAEASGTFTTLGTIDWYAAAASGFNTLKSLAGVVIAGTAGWRKLRCRVSGKNASSSGYYEFLQALQLRRVA